MPSPARRRLILAPRRSGPALPDYRLSGVAEPFAWLPRTGTRWQDAAGTGALAGASGERCGRWRDSYRSAPVAATSESGPDRRGTLAPFGSVLGVQFDGVNQCLVELGGAAGAAFSGNDTPVTVVMALKLASTGHNGLLWCAANASGNQIFALRESGGNWAANRRGDSGFDPTVSNGVTDAVGPRIVTVIFGGTQATIRVDGTTIVAAASLDTVAATLNNFALGGGYLASNGTPSGPSPITVGACLVYPGVALTATQAATVEASLRSECGISLASDAALLAALGNATYAWYGGSLSANGGAIASWTATVGGVALAQSSAPNRPSVGVLNGRRAVQNTRANEQHVSASLTIAAPFEIVVAGCYTAAPNSNRPALVGATNPLMYLRVSGGNTALEAYLAPTYLSASTGIPTTPAVTRLRVTGTTASQIILNGTTVGTGTLAGTLNDLSIGARTNGGDASDSSIAAVAVTTGASYQSQAAAIAAAMQSYYQTP